MGRPLIDLTGQQFNKLTVIERDLNKPQGAGKSVYWICECECGKYKSIRMDKLLKNEIMSCGCYSKEVRTKLFLADLAGQTFGKLTALYRDDTKPKGKSHFAYWICECECGNLISVRGDHLRSGQTQSCGCLNSQGELKISNLLKQNNIKYTQQYSFEDLYGDNALLRFDFAILKEDGTLSHLIEYQGKQHYEPYRFDTTERFEKRKRYDNIKANYCKEHKIRLITIPYTKYDILELNDLL